VELGPIIGMSSAIVDLVSTGKTLQENGLIEIDVLFESSAYLVANPLAYRLNSYDLNQWCHKIINQATRIGNR
jgi:ATP phosphoribosyltransferase